MWETFRVPIINPEIEVLIDDKEFSHDIQFGTPGDYTNRLQTGGGPYIRKGQVFGEVHLRQILSSYAMYYNEIRTTNARSGKEKAHGSAGLCR
jgi:hypothetical protein